MKTTLYRYEVAFVSPLPDKATLDLVVQEFARWFGKTPADLAGPVDRPTLSSADITQPPPTLLTLVRLGLRGKVKVDTKIQLRCETLEISDPELITTEVGL